MRRLQLIVLAAFAAFCAGAEFSALAGGGGGDGGVRAAAAAAAADDTDSPSPPPASPQAEAVCVTVECFEDRRRAAKRRASEALRRTPDPFEGWAAGSAVAARLRDAVRRVCGASGDDAEWGVPSRRTVCLQRGRDLAERLLRFDGVREGQRRFTRRDVLRMQGLFSHRGDAFGVWFRVEDGEVTGVAPFGPRRHMGAPLATVALVVAAAASAGAFTRGQTFEFVATTGDACDWDPFPFFHEPQWPGPRPSAMSLLPVLTYTADENRCPHHVPVPVDLWEWYTKQEQKKVARFAEQHGGSFDAQWAALHPEAVLRAFPYQEAPERVHLALLTHRALLNGTDFAVNPCAARGAARDRCVSGLKLLAAAQYSTNTTQHHRDSVSGGDDALARLCRPRSEGGFCEEEGRLLAQVDHKYLLSVDGFGGSMRFQEYLAAAGVVVQTTTRYQWYYTPDLAGFVTHVDVGREPGELLPSVAAALLWLRRNDAEARNISQVASQYRERHLDLSSKLLYFALFAAVYDALWDDSLRNETEPIENLGQHKASPLEDVYNGTSASGLSCDTVTALLKRAWQQHGACSQEGHQLQLHIPPETPAPLAQPPTPAPAPAVLAVRTSPLLHGRLSVAVDLPQLFAVLSSALCAAVILRRVRQWAAAPKGVRME